MSQIHDRFQTTIAGSLLGLWPSSEGRYQPEAYRAAFGLLLAAQAAAALWLLTARSEKT